MIKKIVVLPSDPLQAYLQVGMTENEIRNYYNPNQYYEEVFVLTPFERGISVRMGMTIIGVHPMFFCKWIKKIKPDVVRAYDGFKCADWACATRVRGISVICSVHDTNPELIYDSLSEADGIICMSEAVKQAVINKIPYIDQKQITVMPNRVDTTIFCKRNDAEFVESMKKKYPYKYPVILVGRKTEQKNIDTVIKSLKYLSNEYCLIMIGRGETANFEKLAAENKVLDRCFFIDFVQHDELPKWFSWCGCMCTPSRWEGFGFVFIEAAACEAAIVTSNIAPMNEYLSDGENAYLVDDYENPQAMAEGIKKACVHSEFNEQIRKNARKVGEHFSKESIDKIEIEVMERISFDKKNKKRNFLLFLRVFICKPIYKILRRY